MKRDFKRVGIIALCALMLVTVIGIGCSEQATPVAKVQPTKTYDEETLTAYSDLANAGYKFMEEPNYDSAIAKFTEMATVIPDGKLSNFNLACAYARKGEADQAFVYLNKMADAGWDQSDYLEYDEDIQLVSEDARFAGIAERIKNNEISKSSSLKNRMPVLETAPKTFASEEEYKEWADAESLILRRHSQVWNGVEYSIASIEFAAKKLACQNELKKDDPEFDYGLERVRGIVQIKSIYSSWGAVSHAVLAEVDAYMATNPEVAKANEANFMGGMAWSMKSTDDATVDANFAKADGYLDKISEGDDYFGAAQTLKMVNKLEAPNADKDALKEEFRALTEKYSEVRWAKRVIGSRLGGTTAELLWPLELGMNDIDGKMTMLDDYKGKVVLIDFWATWCGPCLAELPNVVETFEKYNDKGFEVLSISLDYENRKDLESYREWIGENKMNWRHIYDGKGWGAELAGKYFVSSIPAAYLIGPDGSMAATGEDCRGAKLAESVEKALAAISN